ncbi:MAG: methylenetetrahydrofolate reductase [Bryobacteraceae bacterium]
MNTETLKQYALQSTYEISCLTNMAKVAEEVGAKGVTIAPGTMFSIVDKSTDPGTKDIERVKTIERSAQLVKLGFRPIPHIAARRYKDKAHLSGIVQALLDVGVDGVLLLAGDPKQPAGSFAAAMDMADTGLFDDARIKSVAFAGHPYGNPNTVAANTASELKRKNAWAAAHKDKEVFLWSQVCYSPSKFVRWMDQMEREGNKLPVHPGVMLGDVKAKFAFAHGNFVQDRPLGQQIRGYMKMLGIGAAQGIDGIGSLMATIPTGFITKMADRAATDKRLAQIHYYSGFGAAAVKQALEVNHKFATGQPVE